MSQKKSYGPRDLMKNEQNKHMVPLLPKISSKKASYMKDGTEIEKMIERDRITLEDRQRRKEQIEAENRAMRGMLDSQLAMQSDFKQKKDLAMIKKGGVFIEEGEAIKQKPPKDLEKRQGFLSDRLIQSHISETIIVQEMEKPKKGSKLFKPMKDTTADLLNGIPKALRNFQSNNTALDAKSSISSFLSKTISQPGVARSKGLLPPEKQVQPLDNNFNSDIRSGMAMASGVSLLEAIPEKKTGKHFRNTSMNYTITQKA